MLKRGLILVGLASGVSAGGGYELQDTYTDVDFLEAGKFNYYSSSDPTHGFVDYVDANTAASTGLVNVTSTGQTYVGVDAENVTPNGRPSIRLESKIQYDSGLFVLDLEHMPTGCGTWPAFWLVGSSWPKGGEADIIEVVDKMTAVQTTLHTDSGCEMSGVDTASFTGSWNTGSDGNPATDCDVNAPNQYSNQGCSMAGPESSTGVPFNEAGGGTFAALWDVELGFRMWFFPAGSKPSDLDADHPDPDSWGLPYSRFDFSEESCPSSHFTGMQIIFDVTFCGDWDSTSYPIGCADEISAGTYPATCEDLVANYPSAFAEAYWLINSLKVYTASA